MPQHSGREHAKWSFSNTYRWMACHGQPNLLETMPSLQRRSTTFSDEGTLAHEMLEAACISGSRNPLGPPEIWRSVTDVLDHVDQLRSEVPDIKLMYEKWYVFPQTVVPPNDCAGILDIVGYSPARRAGWLIDFKHGVVPVEADNNAQLWSGATAAFWDAPVDEITLTIIQPNGFIGEPIKSQTIRAADLPDFAEAVSDALVVASRPDAPLVPGDHCRWCPAEPVCLAREEWALREIIDQPAARHLPVAAEAYGKAVDLGIDRIVAIKNAAPALRAWLATIDAYAYEEAMGGTNFPGYKIVETSASRKWTEDHKAIADELITMSNYELSLDDVMPRKLVNITDIEARLKQITGEQATPGKKRRAVEELGHDFAFLTTRTGSGNHALVPQSDKRQAARPVAAAFAHVRIESPEPIGGDCD